MSAKYLGRVWPGIGMIGGLLTWVGCGSAVTASNGSVFRQTDATPNAFSSALAASATHDLPCADRNLEITHLEAQREYLVTGCGSRVLYHVLTPTLTSRRIELVSHSPHAAPKGVEAESKSTAAQL